MYFIITQINQLNQDNISEKIRKIKNEVPGILKDRGIDIPNKFLEYHHNNDVSNSKL